jgi:hypothetical protein
MLHVEPAVTFIVKCVAGFGVWWALAHVSPVH